MIIKCYFVRTVKVIMFLLSILLVSCSQPVEELSLDDIIPNGTNNEWFHAYPDIKMSFVPEDQANVEVMFI